MAADIHRLEKRENDNALGTTSEVTHHQYSEPTEMTVANVGSRIESDKTEQSFGDRRCFIDTEINKIQVNISLLYKLGHYIC